MARRRSRCQQLSLPSRLSVIAQGLSVIAQGLSVIAQGLSVIAQGLSAIAQGLSAIAQGLSLIPPDHSPPNPRKARIADVQQFRRNAQPLTRPPKANFE
jgi:uncharacterized phage infection (PIP) family protein YhgE